MLKNAGGCDEVYFTMRNLIKFLTVLFVIVGLFVACDKKGDGSKGDASLALTEEEKNDNWKYFKEIGFKVRIPKEISDKKDNVIVSTMGDEENDEDPIYNGYLYSYISDGTNKAFDDIIADDSLSNDEKGAKIEKEVQPGIQDMFILAVLRSPLITQENTIEKILGADDITVLEKNAEFTQAIAIYSEGNLSALTEEEKKDCKALMQVAKEVKKGAKAGKPVPKKASLQEIQGLKFKTQDLAGNEVTSEVLKKADITMVNIWATWCAPCRAELPYIGELERKYRAKGAQVIAICSDVTDEDDSALEEAKEIIEDAKCEFLVLRKNNSLQSIYAHIQAYPTTLFFDKNGNVVGSIVIGGRSEEQFAALLDEALEKVKK